MIKRKITLVLILALCISIAFSLTAFAENKSSSNSQSFRITADEETLIILNELNGTDISYGELIEKAYPEAIKYIPEDLLQHLYKEKVRTISPYETSGLMAEGNDEFTNPSRIIPIVTNNLSTLTVGSGHIYHSSSSAVVFPPIPFPHMMALSELREEDGTIVSSAIESLDNTFGITASKYFTSPVPGKRYYVTGVHAGKSPSGYAPDLYAFYTATPLKTY